MFHGAADPSVIWNPTLAKWLVYYTNRRATLNPLKGELEWIHGTAIGIASSCDGVTWKYEGVCQGDGGLAEPIGHNCTWWAPCVYRDGKVYHLFLARVAGIPTNTWDGVAEVRHFVSDDGFHWKARPTPKLSSNRVIDPCIAKIGGKFYLWYKDEGHKSHTWMASSDNLDDWKVEGEVVGDTDHEGPLVFAWKGKYWMAVDAWKGLRFYRSDDGLKHWTYNTNILEEPGRREKDNFRAAHPFILVQDERAFVFYMVHYLPNDPVYATRRSVLQVAELEMDPSGKIACNRDKYAH